MLKRIIEAYEPETKSKRSLNKERFYVEGRLNEVLVSYLYAVY